MYHVYAITSLHRKYTYIGLTNNPERRINQHNQGYNRTTKPYRPFKLILLESFPTREMARAREKILKTGVGREFLKNIINGGGAGLSTDR
jgi:putative endonuclease